MLYRYIIYALVLDGYSVWFLLTSTTLVAPIGFFLTHVIAAAVFAQALHGFLMLKYSNAKTELRMMIFVICLFMPWFSTLAFLGALVLVRLHRESPNDVAQGSWHLRNLPPLPKQSLFLETSKSDLSNCRLKSIIKWATEPELRQNAVLSTLALRDREAIPLLRLALRDTEDDIRLLAFALLDRKEKTISTRIRQREVHLQDTSQQCPELHHGIAQDCWELVHAGLVQGEVRKHYLDRANQQIDEAIRQLPRSANLYLLRGKILLVQEKWELAFAAFQQAKYLGIDSSKIGPYLAEIAFAQNRLAEVSPSLQGYDVLSSNPKLYNSARFWQKQH